MIIVLKSQPLFYYISIKINTMIIMIIIIIIIIVDSSITQQAGIENFCDRIHDPQTSNQIYAADLSDQLT